MPEIEGEGPSEEPQPRGELEGVPAKEYEDALVLLDGFAEKDTLEISGREGLEQHMTGVGKALDAIIRARGEIQRTPDPSGNINVRRVLRKELPGEKPTDGSILYGLLESKGVTVKVTTGKGFKDQYRINIPLHDKFEGETKGYNAVEYIHDSGEAASVVYAPGMHLPHTDAPGYANTLQRCVKDVLSVTAS